MSRRLIHLLILVLAWVFPAAAESADCGCGAAEQPCTQETLTTVPMPDTVRAPVSEAMEFTIASCWGCGSSTMDFLPVFLVASILFLPMAAVQRVVCGPDHLIVLRLGDCNAT